MSSTVNGHNNHSLTAWTNWATTKLNEVRGHAANAHAQVQQGHLTFIESCAQGLNGQLKNMIDDGDVKAVKAIIFNTSTVTLVSSVALFVFGSMSFLGAAVVIALSLAGRSIVDKSFVTQLIQDAGVASESIDAYKEPEKLLEAGGYPVFYKMDPIIEISPRNLPGDNYNQMQDTRIAITFRLFKAVV